MTPALEDFNGWVDFWRYKGFNVIPANSVNKTPLVKWKEYQTTPISEEQHNQWKSENKFKDGYAIIVGKLWHGENAGLYGNALDYDKIEAVEKWFTDWDGVLEAAKKSRIEWHQNKVKLHYLFYTKTPLKNRNLSIGIEVRAENELLYCGLHKDGNYWTPLGTDKIPTLDESQLQNLEKILDNLSNGNDNKRSTARERNDPNYVKHENENRSIDLLQEMDSLLLRNHGLLDDDTIKQLARYWHDKHCRPTYSNEKFESNWKQALGFRNKKASDFPPSTDNEEDPLALGKPERKKKVAEALFAVTRSYRFATFEETDEILYYLDGAYHHGGEVTIRTIIERLFEQDATINLCREVLDHVRRATYHKRKEFDADLNIINLKNGLYYVQENELKPHIADYLSLNQKPFAYDANAVPKHFGKYLSEVVYSSDIDTVIELMGYTFHRDNPFEIITLCHGFGGNGKSVLFGVLTALHGNHNVSHVSLKTILERPFGLYELVDKDVNLDAELSSGIIKDTALLKKITGRERCYVEQKNQKGFYAVIHAKPWFSCNLIPTIYNASNADFRRIYVISFPETFEEDRQNPNLIYELTTENELSCIFNILMTALRRVLKNKKVTVNQKTIEERRIKYEMASNPVKTFTELAFEQSSLEASDYSVKDDVFRAFVMFCTENKLALISKESLGRKLKSVEYRWEDAKRTIFGKKVVWCWIGHKLTVEYDRKIGNTTQETFTV